MGEPSGEAQLRTGEVRRHTLLGSSAIYEVLAIEGASVLVRVLEAPGLARDLQLRLAAEAVRGMERIARSAADERPAEALTPARPNPPADPSTLRVA